MLTSKPKSEDVLELPESPTEIVPTIVNAPRPAQVIKYGIRQLRGLEKLRKVVEYSEVRHHLPAYVQTGVRNAIQVANNSERAKLDKFTAAQIIDALAYDIG